MNDLEKPDLKHGVPLSSIPEVGHRRRGQRKLKFQSISVCAVVIVFATCHGLALEPGQLPSSYLRKYFTMEDGLPSNDVHAIVQTENGFLWVGTDAGLARFDGKRFTSINIRGGVAQQISVRSLLVTPEGDLWVGTDAGVARLPRAALDHFDRALVAMYHLGLGINDQILCMHRSGDGTLWIGSSGGLYRFDRGNFISIIAHDTISRIEERSNGHLLIITGHGFVESDGERMIPHPEIAQQLGVVTDGIFHAYEDHKGVTWFCTNKGVARSVGGRITKLEPWDLPHGGAWWVYEDQQGNIWVVGQSGLFRANATSLEPMPGLEPRFAYSDREGDLWVCNANEGLVRFKDRAVRMYTTSDGLPNNRVSTVLRSHDGTLWVGNNCGGISRFDGKRFQNYDEKDGLSNSCVFSMAEDTEHNLWIGTWGGGLYRFRDGHFTQYSEQQGLPSNIIVCIVAAPNGSLWIATSAGLSHMQNGHFRNYSVSDGLSSDLITTVYHDRAGTIWVGTSAGVDRLLGDRFVTVSWDAGSSNALFRTLREDSSGDLYAFSEVNGISRLEDNRLVSVNETLAWGSMIESVRHDLWFSGRQGIFRVAAGGLRHAEQDRETPLDYSSFGPDDGMNSKECDKWGQPSMAITPHDNLWVATVKGLARLDLQRLKPTNHKPAIYMEEVDVGRTKASPGRELVLHPGTYHVEFHFTAVDLVSPEKIRLQYRLDGVDPLWLDADSTRTAIYNSIPVGAHSFHIRACNRDGVWDRGGTVYSVIQQPFLYETTWFRLSALAVIGLLVASIYRWRVYRLKSQEKRLRDVVETIPAMTFTTLSDGSNTFVNKRWTEYTGLSVEQSSGAGWQRAVHPEDLAEHSKNWRNSVATGRIFEGEARFCRATDGEYRWFLVRGVPLRDRHANIVKWYGTLTDIEDLKRSDQEREKMRELEADLAHIDRISLMGEMAASFAHEIKQPIAAAITSANSCIEWLAHEPPNLDRARAAASKVDKYGKNAAEIIDHIRSFYKKSPPQRELVDVNGIIKEMLTLLKGEATRYSIEMRTELAAELPKIMVDRVQLQQVFMNLMLNGIEAMGDSGGQLTVKSELQDGHPQFSISDTGVGLPTEKAEKIFSAFFTTKTQGSGMGLAISRSIVESHGGQLWASANTGGGATFHFTLPTVAEQVKAASEET
jgi:PAS domain S-box-containing protein